MSTQEEKPTGKAISPEHLEHLKASAFDTEGGDVDRRALERKLLWKLDLRFVFLVLIYILNYIDRNNVPASRSHGLTQDLNLTGTQYQTLLSILYVGYIIMQIPSNMIMVYFGRPSLYLPFCMAIWGMISILTGITNNFVHALLTRFFLGFVEAAYYPGAICKPAPNRSSKAVLIRRVDLLSAWYTKKELGLRVAFLYCGSLISNAFGPLIAAGILGTMEGKLGVRAWRWLFYIEGSITIFLAIVAVFVLPDFPHNSRGFSEPEKQLAQLRLAEDAGEADSDEKGDTWEAFKVSMLDPNTWIMALTLTSMVIGLGFNQFFPTLTASLGYGNTVSLLLCAPPFAFATFAAFFTGWHSDKTSERTWHIIVPLAIGIVGFIIAMSTTVIGPRYFALFLMAVAYSGFCVFYAWIGSSFPRPPMRRAVCVAFINAFSQLGNVTSAYIFPANWGPTYAKSYAISLSCFVFCICGVLFHRFNLQRLNKKIAAREEAMDRGEIVEELAAMSKINVPRGFRYVL
ncbi:hypothetical protein MNV49_000747 [Pseudohyphozyma bogoriensis]|nr:hypothetical protein MNV49_000747 [Pseudohyphozyma bogoriensis]